MNHRTGRSGFSLIELIVALVIGTVITGSLVGLFIRQIDFYRHDDAIRDARTSARAALNVILSDTRMVERSGGVVEAESRDITLRVPYLWGTVCASNASVTDVSLFPVDSMAVAAAGFSGWASRTSATGDWVYREGGHTVEDSDGAVCAGASVTPMDGGSTIRITPGGGSLRPGTPIMLYQQIRYRFAPSLAFPGRGGLFRTVVETDADEELVSPFSDSARFRFHVTGWDADDDPPADLSTIRGLEVHLDAESFRPSPTTNEPHPFSLITSVFFMNADG